MSDKATKSNKQSIPAPKPGVMDIAAYVPGKSAAPKGVKLFKLSSNETPLGPSEKAISALETVSSNLALYPDGSATELKKAIAAVHGLNIDNILCGNGSDEILSLIGQTYLTPGDEVVYSAHGFLMYHIVALCNGAVPVIAEEENETANVDNLLGLVSDKTRLVFLANPNNPTGSYLSINEVRRLQQSLPGHVVLVLDAAYAEYVSRNDYEAGIELVSTSDNVIMTRTFSKIYGLAGLRIGWCYGPKPIIAALERVRGPFNLNSMAIAAGAAAIVDQAHVTRAADFNRKWVEWLTEKIESLGLRVTPSVGNFILIHFDEASGKSAQEADRFLTGRGLILRAVTAYGFDNALRMSVGTEQANQLVVAALSDFLTQS